MKPKTKKKPKKPNIKTLQRKAWTAFSLYIRNRDKKCISCQKELPVEELQAGHFYHKHLNFDEQNINAQCKRCNGYLHGNLAPYSVHLLIKLTQEGFLQLYERYVNEKENPPKFTREYYQNIIEKYKPDNNSPL